jgi:hypothetical protein
VPRPSSKPIWVPSSTPVGDSADLRRVIALPRRPPFDEKHDHSALVDRLSSEFRRPGSQAELFPVQAFCIDEMRRVSGLVGLLAPSAGKTLLAQLLVTALGVRTAVLLLPPKLKAQLLLRSYPALVKDWRVPQLRGVSRVDTGVEAVLHPVAYSELSDPEFADVLDWIQPELIVADEAHNLRRVLSARTGRFIDHVVTSSKAGTLKHVALLSGSMAQESIKDLRFVIYALGKYAPIAISEGVLQAWADALDPLENPSPPGRLMDLAEPGESARSAFRRRLVETPGVVATTQSPIATRLEIHARRPVVPPAVEAALAKLYETWTTPWDEEITDHLMFSRVARQVASGFVYRVTWPRGEAPELRNEWLTAKNEWHREVRNFLAGPRVKGLDSLGLLEDAAVARTRPSKRYDRWDAVRPLAEPAQETIWIDDFVVRDALEWTREHRGLIWYAYRAFEAKLAEAGLPVMSGGAASERVIPTLDGSQSVAISWDSHREGTDGLQLYFADQLFTFASGSAARLDQALARLHRVRQPSRVVKAWIPQHTPETIKAFEHARKRAEVLEETFGNVQKLNIAHYCLA